MMCTVKCKLCDAKLEFNTENEPIFLSYIKEDIRSAGWTINKDNEVICPECMGTAKSSHHYGLTIHKPSKAPQEEVNELLPPVGKLPIDDYSEVPL